jgi:VWFA-related protein
MVRFIPVAAVSLFSVVALAQQAGPGSAPPPTLRVTTRLVYVDVLVRDKSGQVVTGLTQQDFKITEDGHPETVKYFVAHVPEATNAPALATVPVESRGEFSNVDAGTAARPMTILLFDLLNTPTDDQLTGRQQMLKFLSALPAGERLCVFTLSNGLQMTQGLSGSPALLESVSKMLRPVNLGLETSKTEAMQDDQVAGNFNKMSSPGGVSLPGPTASTNAGTKPDSQSYETRARSTISALGQLAHAMSDYPGRKSLYWLSESYPLSIEIVGAPVNTDPSSGSETEFDTSIIALQGHFSQTSKDEMRETLNRLAGARIAVYPVSVFGLTTHAASAAVTSSVEFGTNPGDPRGGFFTMDNLKAEMDDLARSTGGEAIFGNNDIAGAIRRTMDDSASYYTLAYTPTNEKWNGQFRAVRVNATGGSNLIYRRGYFATPDGSATDTGEDFARSMQPGVPEETGLRLRSRILPQDPQHAGLMVESTINSADVAFATTADGHKRAQLFVQLVAFSDVENQPKALPQTSGTLNIDLDPQKYQFILSAGIAFRQELALKPGAYRVLLGVSDQNSHKVGTIEMPITVPADQAVGGNQKGSGLLN